MGKAAVLSAVLLILLVLVSYGFYSVYTSYVSLKSRVDSLVSENNRLKSDVEEWKRYASNLESQNRQLMSTISDLERQINKYIVWLNGNSSRVKVLESQLSRYKSIFDELNKLNETYYYRGFRLKDYRNPRVIKETCIHLGYPGKAYIDYRLYKKHMKMALKYNPVTGEYVIDPELVTYVKNIVKESKPVFKKISEKLLVIYADGDVEFFVNLVLQIVHQLKYMETTYSKYPVETLVEGVGDCDCLSILLATFLEAAGIDAVLIIEKLDNGLHVQVGVNLPKPPDDLFKYGRNSYKYINYNGKQYYIAEATWDVTKADPLDPSYLGFFVGDPVKTGKVITIIDV